MQPQQAMAAGCPAPSPLAALAPADSQNRFTAIASAVEPSSSALPCPEISMASDGGAPGPTMSAEQTDSDARPPVASHAIQNLLSTARSVASSNCRYRECLKNHAASLGAHATDGCGEFMAAGEEGSVEALFCAACRCHRNFHRRETVQESSHPSLLHLPPPPPPAHHQQQQQHHQYGPSSNIYCDKLYPHATTLLNPRFAGTLGSNISKRSVNLSDRQLPPPPPLLADGMPPSRRHRLALPTNTLPAPPPAMIMAFNNSHHIHELHHQNEEEEENDDDSNMNLEFGYPIKHKNCGIQYNHPFMSMSPSCLMNSTTTSTTTTTSLNHNYNYNYNPNHNQKRFRTKFTCEQKEKMWHFAEKIGWRFHKDDDDAVRKFCAEVGVKRHVLKVWMHNNKHNLLGTKVKALSPNT